MKLMRMLFAERSLRVARVSDAILTVLFLAAYAYWQHWILLVLALISAITAIFEPIRHAKRLWGPKVIRSVEENAQKISQRPRGHRT